MEFLINTLVITNVMLGIGLFVALMAQRDKDYAARVRAEEKWKSHFRRNRRD
ncbi:MAG: hypothetical protein AAGF13_06105 [Pseudomonadota bacterium]